MLAIGTKVTQAFLNGTTGEKSIIAGVIVDQTFGKADGANGPVGEIYEIVSLETARPENGGHQYLGFRHPTVDSWSLAPRMTAVPELDDFESVEALVAAAYQSRQEAHLRSVAKRANERAAEAGEPLPF